MKEWTYNSGDLVVTDEMKAAFDEDGFVIFRKLLNDDEVRKISTSFFEHGILDKYAYKVPDSDGKSPTMALWRHPGSDVTGLLSRTEKVVSTCEKLLGVQELYHYHGKFLLKQPQVGGKFEWHQDYGYWYHHCVRPDMMAAYFAIDDVTQENGGLQMLKGSHKVGRIDHGFVSGQQGADLERVELLKARYPLVKPDLYPGDAIFFHSNVLHCSGPNTSTKRRLGLNISYNEAGNSPIVKNICPEYTKLNKVPNNAVIDSDNVGNFEGKEFINADDDKLVKADTS